MDRVLTFLLHCTQRLGQILLPSLLPYLLPEHILDIDDSSDSAETEDHVDGTAGPTGDYGIALKSQADVLMAAYTISELPETLLQVIALYEGALEHSLDETRASHVADLGNALLLYCSDHGTEPDRLDRCIELHRELLSLRHSGHPLRDQALHSLAKVLYLLGFETHLSRPEALTEAIQLNREAEQLRPPGHPDRDKTMNNLAICLARSYETCGDMNTLDESITVLREVLHQRPLGHPRRGEILGNLGTALLSSFYNHGSYAVLSESMSLCREALHLRPEGHPAHYRALENLANVLQSRFMHNGIVDVEASYEAEGYLRNALRALPEAHPERRWVMANLASSLIARFREQGGSNILDETISLLRTAAALSPAGHHLDESLFNTLAEALELKLDQESDSVALLSEVISLHRTVLKARPHGHARRVDSLHSLARVLCRPQARAYEEALPLYNEALESPSKGYSTRAMVTSDMSACFLDVDSPFFDLLKGVSSLAVGYADNASPINQRLKFAVSDLRRVEDAYQATTKNADATAQAHIDFQVLRLYVQVLGLLPRAANFGIACKARLLAVSGSDEIARNGAARAIISGDLSQSVEMLEEGRGVFWSQSLHLRTGCFEDVPEEEREKLLQLLRLLGNGARRLEGHDQTTDQRERDFETCRRLNDEAEALISEIRALPGLDRFLMPPAFASLFDSLPDGFVVILNASRLGYYGLLCNRATRLATSLELNPDRSGLDPAILRAKLPRDMYSGSQTRAMRLDSGGSGSLQVVLSLLWSGIVQPIISKLGLQKSSGRARPRLWWCVTGELGFLPIHAAGSHERISSGCTADYVVSSYIPTLSSLTRARASWHPVPRTKLAGLLICEESSDNGSASHLPNAAREIRLVRESFDKARAPVLNASSPHTSLAEIRSLLEETSAHILHVACHGVQDADPLKSAIVLQDGKLTIEDIMSLRFPHAVLAFLSACETAKGDRNAPDQAVHLAASMLFCGFRSVIGTMWLMHDADGPDVARRVYEALFQNDSLDLDDVPYALDEAVESLRRAGVPADRWALYIHMGG